MERRMSHWQIIRFIIVYVALISSNAISFALSPPGCPLLRALRYIGWTALPVARCRCTVFQADSAAYAGQILGYLYMKKIWRDDGKLTDDFFSRDTTQRQRRNSAACISQSKNEIIFHCRYSVQ